ncbi:MAG: hypothetical protein ACOY0T_30695 [Myxococcota bacterium]
MSIWNTAKKQAAPIDSVVDFPTDTRFHIALNVVDVEPLLPFYNALFNQEPTLSRDGYTKYEVTEPPIIFSLNRVAHNARGHGDFGFEAKSSRFVRSAEERLLSQGFTPHNQVKLREHLVSFEVEDSESNKWTVFVRT